MLYIIHHISNITNYRLHCILYLVYHIQRREEEFQQFSGFLSVVQFRKYFIHSLCIHGVDLNSNLGIFFATRIHGTDRTILDMSVYTHALYTHKHTRYLPLLSSWLPPLVLVTPMCLFQSLMPSPPTSNLVFEFFPVQICDYS